MIILVYFSLVFLWGLFNVAISILFLFAAQVLFAHTVANISVYVREHEIYDYRFFIKISNLLNENIGEPYAPLQFNAKKLVIVNIITLGFFSLYWLMKLIEHINLHFLSHKDIEARTLIKLLKRL